MRPVLIYLTINLLVLLGSLSMNAVSVAFPQITTEFDTSLVIAGWVLSIYMLVATVSAVLVGKVTEILGKKQTFFLCAALFILGSLISAVAPNIQLLIFARFIQSLGGGGFVPVIAGIITDLFPRSRPTAIGLSMSIFNIGGIIGPSIGAWLVSSWGWRSVFWFNVPIGILVCIPLLFLLSKDSGKKGNVDYIGAALLTGALFATIIGLSQVSGTTGKLNLPLMAVLLIAGVIMIWIFSRHIIKHKDPILDPDLLRLRPFAASNFVGLIHGFIIFSFGSFIPLYAISVYGMTTLQAGLILTANAISSILATTFNSFMLPRWGYRTPLLIAGSMLALCFLAFSLEPGLFIFKGMTDPLTVLIVIAVLSGVGTGAAGPASGNACIDIMPDRAATISGVRSMFIRAGGTIGIAVITLVVQFVGNSVQGFQVAFLIPAALGLISIPFVFAMPARPILAK